MGTPERYSATHLDDATLREEASAFALGERSSLVQFLVRLAEIDVRQLYVGAGFASMLEFCMEEYRLTEDEALKRIQAARAASDFPALFEALGEGEVCLNRIRMMAPQATQENLAELIEGAKRHRRLADFRKFLDRFTKPDLLASASSAVSTSPIESGNGPISMGFMENAVESGARVEVDDSHARGHTSRPPIKQPGSPPGISDWVELRIKAPRAQWEELRNLLSHSIPSGDASKIFLRMLETSIEKEKRRKFAASRKIRKPRPEILRRERTIPAEVRRAVVERDGAQCTFVSKSGRRCTSRRQLEYDHIVPLAQGGKSTSKTFGCSAASTISTWLSKPLAPNSWRRSATRHAPRKQPEFHRPPRSPTRLPQASASVTA